MTEEGGGHSPLPARQVSDRQSRSRKESALDLTLSSPRARSLEDVQDEGFWDGSRTRSEPHQAMVSVPLGDPPPGPKEPSIPEEDRPREDPHEPVQEIKEAVPGQSRIQDRNEARAAAVRTIGTLLSDNPPLQKWAHTHLSEFMAQQAAPLREFHPEWFVWVLQVAVRENYPHVAGIDWGAVDYLEALLPEERERVPLPLHVQIQLSRRLVLQLHRPENRERVLVRARQGFATAREWVRDIQTHESDWFAVLLFPTPIECALADERFAQVFDLDPLRSTTSPLFWTSRYKARHQTQDTSSVSALGPLYLGNDGSLSPFLLLFHYIRSLNLTVLRSPRPTTLPFLLLSPIVAQRPRGSFGVVRVYFLVPWDQLAPLVADARGVREWMDTWHAHVERQARKPRESFCIVPLRPVSPRAIVEDRFAQSALQWPLLAVKTMPIDNAQMPGVTSMAPLLDSFYMTRPAPTSPPATVEVYQTVMNKDRVETVMQGVHIDLSRFNQKFHPLGRGSKALLAHPVRQNLLVYFCLQATVQLGRAMQRMWREWRLFHGDIKLDNAGVTFVGDTQRIRFQFRWFDLDCASVEGAVNRMCAPFIDPLSAKNVTIGQGARIRDDELPTDETLFHTDIFRFSLSIMRLWSNRPIARLVPLPAEEPVSRSLEKSDDKPLGSRDTPAPREPLQLVEEDLKGEGEDEAEPGQHLPRLWVPETRGFIRSNLHLVIDQDHLGTRDDKLVREASRLIRDVMRLQVFVRSRLARFDALLDRIDTFLVRPDVVERLVVPSETSPLLFSMWKRILSKSYTVHIAPQWEQP